MKRIAFNSRFINGTDLAKRKIHTIRANYNYWKMFEGRDMALFVWEGVPYRSKQQVVCVKRIVTVQKVYKSEVAYFWLSLEDKNPIPIEVIMKNDGFENEAEFIRWFMAYPSGEMAVLHFTSFLY
jgi:hypothetical protein